MKKIFFFAILNFVLITSNSFAQNKNIDSLLTLINKDKSDTNKVNHLNKLSVEFINIGEYDSSLKYAYKALTLASSLPEIYHDERGKAVRGWAKGMAISYSNIGLIYNYEGNYPEALKKQNLALKIRENIDDKKGIANSYNNIGNIYSDEGNAPEALKNYSASLRIRETSGDKKNIAISYCSIGIVNYNRGNYPEALKNQFSALRIREEIGDKQGIAASYNNIGNIYYAQGNYPEALKNQFSSLKIREDIGDKRGIASSYNNIGAIYGSQGNYSEALKNYEKTLNIFKEIKDKINISRSYNNIGVIYYSQKKYPEALKNHFSSLEINEDIGNKEGIVESFINLGEVHIELRKLNEAQNYLNKALLLSIEIGSKDDIKDSYCQLCKLDSTQGNWKQAYEHHKLYIVYKDSIDNEETKKKTIESTMTYEFDKKELAIKAEQDKKDAVTLAESKKQKVVIALVVLGLLLVLMFSGFIFKSLRVTKKQKSIIEEKNKLVEEKNKDIIDSINYAKKIQNALLKEEEHVSEHLPDHFILFKPKDIVSGDFYWSLEKNGYWYIAAVDCTGHGVPGAFMSMLGIAFLNEITAGNYLLSPAEILDQLRSKIVKELGQAGKSGQSKDGMDISLARLNLETKELQWSGANNSIYIIQNTFAKNFELIEIKPNKQPIGYHLTMQPFNNHVIQLKTGMAFYLFTDGYADQFGGPKEKKFLYSKLKELLVSLRNKAMNEQKEILNQTFENWKGKIEQVDDVCVIGISI